MNIWYSAERTNAAPLTFGDYARGEEAQVLALQGLEPLTPAQRAKILAMPGRAVRDAKPAAGKFPLILYSLGSPSVAHVTPEYLASHGYVVVQAPRLGYATALAGARGEAAPGIERAFHSWNRQTLHFLDAHLKGGAYKPPQAPRASPRNARRSRSPSS